MCDFQALDIVECIDDRPNRPESVTMPQLGQLYTVDTVRRLADGHSVRLIEIDPECHLGGPCACGDCGWDARRFRKVRRSGAEQADALLAAIRTKLLEPA